MKLQKVQRATFLKEFIQTTSKVTGLSIIIQNPQDFPMTDEELHLDNYYFGHWSPFCTLVKACPGELKLCGEYEQGMARRARATKVPFFTECRFGVVDVHIPILDGDKFLGSIVCGQVFMEKPNQKGLRKIVQAIRKDTKTDMAKLRKIYFKAPHITSERLDDVANRMDLLSRYIVEAYEKNKLLRVLRNQYTEDLSVGAGSRDEAIIRKAIAFIETNYNKDITRDDASRAVFLSPHYFSRLFKKISGKSFSDYLIRLRLEKAKEMMLTTPLSIKEIAYRMGFSNPYYFSRLFKKREGIPPKSFRSSPTRK